MFKFGDDYPNQFERAGYVFRLKRETRWNRIFSSDDGKTHTHVSRLLDGSATITPEQLEQEWRTWSERERKDFCDGVHWLPSDGRERICRFLRQHGSLDVVHNCVSAITRNLPVSESVPWLLNCIGLRPPGTASNFLQSLAYTKAPEGSVVIRSRLEECFAHPDFGKDDSFLNWVAAEGLNSIQFLIELGHSPLEFRNHSLKLADHVCAGVRDSFDRWLRKHYKTDAAFAPKINPAPRP